MEVLLSVAVWGVLLSVYLLFFFGASRVDARYR
ncbi:hypothetical protein SAMN05421809_3352 [Natronorubrum daqingense]|uniref:Uncharacterized protein n=1 Tax=Natronorubrum daqingense TaxID=588898 RepID=A0A1N7FLQ8_9EURY|nr:hypothetical protein SAMN05421809_3352 [Natronorubrum daqingense]